MPFDSAQISGNIYHLQTSLSWIWSGLEVTGIILELVASFTQHKKFLYLGFALILCSAIQERDITLGVGNFFACLGIWYILSKKE